MAFNFGRFKEQDILGKAVNSAKKQAMNAAIAKKDQLLAGAVNSLNAKKNQLINSKLSTISTVAMSHKRWFGFSVEECQQHYQQVYSLGQILNCSFYIQIEPFEDNGTASLPLFQDNLTGFLATESSLPVINIETEQMKIGTLMLNQPTGRTEPEIQMTLAETADARILTSLIDLADMIIAPDGTMAPMADYLIWMTIGVFDNYGLQNGGISFSRRFPVYPSVSSLDGLTGKGVSEILEVPVTWVVARNFME